MTDGTGDAAGDGDIDGDGGGGDGSAGGGDIVPVSRNGEIPLPITLMTNDKVSVSGVGRAPSLNANDKVSPSPLAYAVI